jgi:hypothetical protein
MVFDHQTEHTSQWAPITSIASKIGCNPETLLAVGFAKLSATRASDRV